MQAQHASDRNLMATETPDTIYRYIRNAAHRERLVYLGTEFIIYTYINILVFICLISVKVESYLSNDKLDSLSGLFFYLKPTGGETNRETS